MAFCYVNIGSSANDGSGDPIRTAFNKINDNFTYVIGLGGGGGNVTANVDLTNYATITLVESGLANVTGVNLSALNNALANVNAVNLSALNNALANVNAVNLSNLNAALANVNAVSLNALNNALANLSLINLNNLNNALATVNFSLLGNVSNLVSAVSANTPAKVNIVSNLNTPGTTTGQTVLNNTDNGLYVWNGTAWTTASAAFTPNANSVAGVQVVSSLPVTGNFEGRQVLFNGALYIYSGGAFKSTSEVLAPTANSLTGIQIYTGAALPATTAAESGRTIFWTNESNLYINIGGAWNNYNSYIQGSGTPSLSAGSVNNAALQDNVITAAKIATGAIIAGKISAGAIGAAEIAANAITAGKIAANAVVAGTIAAGVITSEQIAAGNITASLIASNAIIAGKIAAGAISATEIAAGAIGANQIAANAIVSAKIAANAITAVQIAANAVYANAIQTNSITSAQLAANSITAVQLAANSVYANAIQTNSITSAQIAANAITAVQLAANTVYAGALQARAITSDKIAANAITAVELAANSVYANAIQTNSITAAQIAANAITAVQLAANSVYANALQANSITAATIAANAITAVQLAANAVYANAIQANSVTTDALAANAITSKHISANTITASMIDSRGLTIRAADGTLLLGAGSGATAVLSNTIVVADNTGTLRTLSNVVTQSGQNAIQFIGNFASNAAADAGYGGSAPVNSVYKNTGDNNTYIKQTGGTWGLFLSTGSTGNSSFTSLIFLQSASQPATPSGGSYNFSTGSLTPPTGWSATAPTTSTTPTWASNYTFTGTGTVSGGTYNTPYKVAQTMADGKTYYAAVVYLQQASTPSTPSGGSFNFSTNTLTPPSGWSTTQPASSTTPTWFASFFFQTTDATTTVTATTWNTPQIAARNGCDGAAGAAGAAGARGNLKVAQCQASGVWSDASACAAISTITGLGPCSRDEVTLYNSPTGFSETRFWTGSAWSTIGAYINGGLVVNGTIGANQIAAGSIDATKICAGAIGTNQLAAGAITTAKICSISGTCIDAGTTSPSKLCSGTSPTQNSLGTFSLGSTDTFNGYRSTAAFNSSGTGAAVNGFNSQSSPSASWAVGGISCGVNFAGVFGSAFNTNWNSFHNLSLLGYADYAALFRAHHSVSTPGNNSASCFRGQVYVNTCPGLTPIVSDVCAATAIQGAMYSTGSDYSPSYFNPLTGQYQVAFAIGTSGDPNNSWGGLFRLNCADGSTQRSRIILAYNDYAAFASGLGYSTAGWTPFTGVHDGLTNETDIQLGDIVVDHSVLQHLDISNSIVEYKKSTTPLQKNVVGVLSKIYDEPPADWYTETFSSPNAIAHVNNVVDGPWKEDGSYEESSVPQIPINSSDTRTLNYPIPTGYKVVNINALGEGLMNVCGENGDIEAGDLIVASSTPGKGMKQLDDIIRNYTVAKARESVTFSSPTEIKQIAVTYHCG